MREDWTTFSTHNRAEPNFLNGYISLPKVALPKVLQKFYSVVLFILD